MGANFGDTMKSGLVGGLSGMSQGMQQYGNPNPQFNFAMPQQQSPLKKKQPLSTNGNTTYPQGPNVSSIYGDRGGNLG